MQALLIGAGIGMAIVAAFLMGGDLQDPAAEGGVAGKIDHAIERYELREDAQ